MVDQLNHLDSPENRTRNEKTDKSLTISKKLQWLRRDHFGLQFQFDSTAEESLLVTLSQLFS